MVRLVLDRAASRLAQADYLHGSGEVMGVLKNNRHELFAQALATGEQQGDAYVSAGFKDNRPAASRLATNVNISERVAELKAEAAEKCVVSIVGLTEQLLRIAGKAEALADAPGLSVARASAMDVAKLNGLVVDKAQITGQIGMGNVTIPEPPLD